VTSVLIVLGVGFESRPVVGAGCQRNEGERVGRKERNERKERKRDKIFDFEVYLDFL
jgi:hypothetical protein